MIQQIAREGCGQNLGRIYTPSPIHQRDSGLLTSRSVIRESSLKHAVNGTLSPTGMSHDDLHDAILRGVIDAISRLGLLERHDEVIDTIQNLPAPSVDLSHITGILTQLLTLKDGHSEVLEAITNVTVEQPDLSPILQAISRLRNPEDVHKEVLDTITNLVIDAPDFAPVQQMMQDMKADIKGSLEVFRRGIQEDMHVLQQEVLKNREEVRSSSEALLENMRIIPQALEELRKEIQQLAAAEIDLSGVLNAIDQISVPVHDPTSIADSVHDRLLRSQLRVDNSDVLESLQNLEVDQVRFAGLVAEKLCKVTLSVDTSEVLSAIRRLPDAEAISKSVVDKTKKVLPDRSDFALLLDSIKRINREPDARPILSALQALEIDLQPVLEAISRIKLDHSPILDLLRKIEIPDIDAIGRVVTERLRKHNTATREECYEILHALRHLPDNSELLESVRGIERSLDLQAVADCVRGGFPDQISIASAVVEKIKRVSLQVDSSEVLAALSGIRLAVENSGHVDGSLLAQEVSRGSMVSGQADILRALSNIQLDIRQLREADRSSAEVVQAGTPPRTGMLSQSLSARPVVQRLSATPVAVQSLAHAGMMSMQETTKLITADAESFGPKMATPAVPFGTMQQTTGQVLPFGYTQVVPNASTSVGPVELVEEHIDSVFMPRSQFVSRRLD